MIASSLRRTITSSVMRASAFDTVDIATLAPRASISLLMPVTLSNLPRQRNTRGTMEVAPL